MGALTRTLAVAVLVLCLDQASKFWVIRGLDLPHRGAIDVFPPLLRFRMAWNQGVNFGLLNMGTSGKWVLIAIALAVCGGLLYWVRSSRDVVTIASVGLIVGGALGNVIDRIIYGAVVDFLNMSCCGIENPYAFNIADAAIFVGVGLLLFFARTDKDHAQ